MPSGFGGGSTAATRVREAAASREARRRGEVSCIHHRLPARVPGPRAARDDSTRTGREEPGGGLRTPPRTRPGARCPRDPLPTPAIPRVPRKPPRPPCSPDSAPDPPAPGPLYTRLTSYTPGTSRIARIRAGSTAASGSWSV
ncbi:hypothetical protein GCM10017750_15490 [Streptomyces racemochromogenes]